jgi:hypothetical protein
VRLVVTDDATESDSVRDLLVVSTADKLSVTLPVGRSVRDLDKDKEMSADDDPDSSSVADAVGVSDMVSVSVEERSLDRLTVIEAVEFSEADVVPSLDNENEIVREGYSVAEREPVDTVIDPTDTEVPVKEAEPDEYETDSTVLLAVAVAVRIGEYEPDRDLDTEGYSVYETEAVGENDTVPVSVTETVEVLVARKLRESVCDELISTDRESVIDRDGDLFVSVHEYVGEAERAFVADKEIDKDFVFEMLSEPELLIVNVTEPLRD